MLLGDNMEIKIQARQSGKTYDIAQRMKKENTSVLITYSEKAKAMFCKKYKIDPKRVFSINKVVGLKSLRFKKIYVDEVGCCMQMIIPGSIQYMTHT